jgi:Ser/Thr protein kinase RdoA (MazF antagonist)
MSVGPDRQGTSIASLDGPLAAEVTRALSELIGHDVAGLRIDVQELRGRSRRVCRVRVSHDGALGSLIAKRLPRERARRVALAMQRWLPGIGMGDLPPALLGAVAVPGAPKVWHLYEDVGEVTLKERRAEAGPVAAAAARIADLHVRGAGHPLVAECRSEGRDFGLRYFLTGVGEARRLLDDLPHGGRRLSPERAAVEHGLRLHLDALLADASRRARVFSEAGGPDTMLHGDLGTANVVVPEGDRGAVRLIDWDHVGAGPAAYDLSTFLLGFPLPDRPGLLAAYQDAAGRAGWRMPPDRELNVLFDSAVRARYAHRIVEYAAARADDGDRAYDALAEVLRWFESLTPVLPER